MYKSTFEDFYYIYEHWLDDKLFYIGKGLGKRAFDFKNRNILWKKKTRNKEDSIVVRIKAYFEKEEEAFEYEEYSIRKASVNGDIKLTNISHNISLSDKDISLIVKSREEQCKRVDFDNYKTLLRYNTQENFHHISKVYNKSMKSKSSKTLLFTSLKDIKENVLLKKLIGHKEIEEILKRKDFNKNPTIEFKSILIYPIEVLSINFEIISDDNIKYVIIDSTSQKVASMAKKVIDTHVETLYIKKYATPFDLILEISKYTKVLDAKLNVNLTKKDKDAFAKELNIRRVENNSLVKWNTIKNAIVSTGIYEVEEKKLFIDKKQVRVSIIRKVHN